MKFNTVFCVVGAVLLNIAGCLGQLDVCGRAPLNTKIIGGLNATEGSWPWQASIHIKSTGKFYCSGSLINKQWVLSAGDVFALVPASNIVIYLGRQTQNGSNPHEIFRTVTKIIKHPNYNSLGSNIALLQLSSSVPFSDYIKPVCLAAAGSMFVDRTESWVTGWGSINTADTVQELKFPDILQEVENPIVNNIECNAAYGGIITDNLLCAGFLNEDGKAPCAGDIGSPLVTKQGSLWIQSGVVVGGYCGLTDYPTIYVRVSEYEDWISYYTNTSLPGFVSYPLILIFTSRGSVNLSSFPLALAFSIISLFISRFF
ncbi:serine protease 27-like [Danio aesculapii]|uniref:serine protease 27-like n=1 Tax=Danio aesculapii TaxID=1142201 RepID=UPI0024C02BD0|nr:serine protease 27-like [Danio aesculapii]